MVKIGVCIFLGLVLVSQVNAAFCMDETNHFTVTEFEVIESASLQDQAMISITGFFSESQYVEIMTFDFTLDGVNWLRRQTIVGEEFGAEVFTTFHIVISIEDYVGIRTKAVVGFMENMKPVWCDYVDLRTIFTA